MWICAKCGTQAQQIEVCSGCGCLMTTPNQPPKEERYQFVLIAHKGAVEDGFGVYGPFESVMSADMWANATLKHTDYEVVLMEAPT